MRTRHRSLFLRLVAGFMLVMFGVWTCLVGAVIYEALNQSTRIEEVALDASAQQAMLLMQALSDRPDAMAAAVAQFEQAENRRRVSNDGEFARPLHVQAWKDGVLVHGAPQLPSSVPANRGHSTFMVDGRGRFASTRLDADRGLAIRAVVDDPESVVLQPSSVGYYVLPLLISFPFLMLPVWFTVRAGLRPVKNMIDEIERREASDLTPLGQSPYKELSPLVIAINRLMERLKERLEREQEFLADAAHELKTPLAVIQVNAEALGSAPSKERAGEAQAGLQSGVARAAHAVHQLLAYARSKSDREKADLSNIDLVELVRGRMALLAPLALQRNVELELRSPEQCMLQMHRESMMLLVDNLIDNAVKYSPQDGQVAVCIETAAGRVRLAIVDQGPGIAPALRGKVFERFYRVPGQDQPGSGLGLAIAERAAQRNNASVTLDAGPGGRGLAATVEFRSGAAST
ncbi:MAG TPA: ATP-binding protein [Noviherbaspirillum sp.]|nr:ATP-binding protein [Noviherbaspirillum sp.]